MVDFLIVFAKSCPVDKCSPGIGNQGMAQMGELRGVNMNLVPFPHSFVEKLY
jgi:hypothetical protein